jgi:hypothetical protein
MATIFTHARGVKLPGKNHRQRAEESALLIVSLVRRAV